MHASAPFVVYVCANMCPRACSRAGEGHHAPKVDASHEWRSGTNRYSPGSCRPSAIEGGDIWSCQSGEAQDPQRQIKSFIRSSQSLVFLGRQSLSRSPWTERQVNPAASQTSSQDRSCPLFGTKNSQNELLGSVDSSHTGPRLNVSAMPLQSN